MWGNEQVPVRTFFARVKEAGYDGVETWLPDDKQKRKLFLEELQACDLLLISHQHQAIGKTLDDYLKSYLHYLSICLQGEPVLINSHSGRDYFSFEDQKRVINSALEFSATHKIEVLHEIHRGRIGYSPLAAWEVFEACPEMKITADFSHWVCVSENLYLTGFEKMLNEAIFRTGHIHARVGFTEGPQVPDPRAEEWKEEVNVFFGWWDRIVGHNKAKGSETLTITPEFGPYPYMWQLPYTRQNVASQWDINNYIKNKIRQRYPE